VYGTVEAYHSFNRRPNLTPGWGVEYDKTLEPPFEGIRVLFVYTHLARDPSYGYLSPPSGVLNRVEFFTNVNASRL